MASGFVNLFKPAGMTSRRAIDDVQRLVWPAKIGHAGTLDPLATGVLVVAVGSATRLIQYIQRLSKSYRGAFLLGRRSTTEDISGSVVELDTPPVPSLADLQAAAARLTGKILQRPPAFSALKVRGRRAYDLARRGIEPELQPREIEVHRLAIVDYSYPELVLSIECSSGTYVRSLGRDLAESVGTAAVMSDLVRTAVGDFRLEEAVDPEQLTLDNLATHLVHPWKCLEHWPKVVLPPHEVILVGNGGYVRCPAGTEGPEWVAVDESGALIAIMVRRTPNLLGPVCRLTD